MRAAAGALLREHKVDEAFELVLPALDAVLQKSRELELLVAKLRRERLGQHSERVNAAQLALLFEELQRQGDTMAVVDAPAETRDDAGVSEEIQAAEDARREAAKEIASKQRKGRLSLPCAERQVHEAELGEDERRCAQCGCARQKIGEEIARRIEYVPGHFVQHEHRLSKYACASCRAGVVTAPGPQRILERSIADASVLAHVVVRKYVDHPPLHRLHESYARTGASIPVLTLSDWTGGVVDLLEPLVKRLGQRVLGAHVVRTDATGLKVLDPRSPANIQRGTIWVYLGDEHDVVFRYAQNYLFAGSHEAARRAAVLYSITRTCALRGVEPLAYLTDVLPKLAGGWPQSRIDELLPGHARLATTSSDQ